MLRCQFCGNLEYEDFQLDQFSKGFWCENCDGYTYLNQNDRENHMFTLVLEDKGSEDNIIYRSDVSFKKQLSPLRYPGGKSKLIEYIYSKLNPNKLDTFVEPFCGGANVGLSFLNAKVINRLILNDLDFGVYSLFYTIKNNPNDLMDLIKRYTPTHEDYFNSRDIIKSYYKDCDILRAAWILLLNNRLAYSGIYKANPLGGKNGTNDKLLSRWNPDNLIKRILHINSMSDRIEVLNMDANMLIEEMYWDDKATIFIDPPYFRKGKDLYNHYYNKHDHISLRFLIDHLYQGYPGADMILTYDNDRYIEDLYWYPEIEKISRVYSI